MAGGVIKIVSKLKVLIVVGTAVVMFAWLYIYMYNKEFMGSLNKRTTPTIYVVTPSGSRLAQKADLTRLSNTLRLVPGLHWILIEDGVNRTAMVAELLNRSRLPYTHLSVPTPKELLPSKSDRILKPRGVAQRNAGLDWIRTNVRDAGVVYFADDDNTYDIRVFDEMRQTQKVSVWPVAFASRLRYESPIVKNGKVVGWRSSYRRQFSTDMAGFAVNTQLIRDHPGVYFRNISGHLETDLLSQLNVTLHDLEARADSCTKVPQAIGVMGESTTVSSDMEASLENYMK